MSKIRKSRHRVPVLPMQQSDPIDARYQVEVDMSTSRLERRYRRAQKALAAAEARAERARLAVEIAHASTCKLQRQYADLLMIVEERRVELREIERLMLPADYANRDSRRRLVRHETGAITVPLGGTTGKHPKRSVVPTFPVHLVAVAE